MSATKSKKPKKAKVVITIRDEDGLGQIDVSVDFVGGVKTADVATPAQSFAMRIIAATGELIGSDTP